MIPLEELDIFGVHCGFNQKVDFCVWILEQDGLKVPPFIHHPDGNGRFRELGLSTTDWLGWFEKVIKGQDQRLNWHVENIQTSLSEAEENFERMNSLASLTTNVESTSKLGKHVEKERLKRNLLWQEQQYQQAITLAGDICRNNFEPSNYWEGSEKILHLLSQLWQVYLLQIRERGKALIDIFLEQRGGKKRLSISPEMFKELKNLQNRSDCLEIYQVIYSHAVEYCLSPVYIVVSLNFLDKNSSNSQSILRMAQQLIENNK